jgi:biofilm PGA synthesis lipoprotein PgaB
MPPVNLIGKTVAALSLTIVFAAATAGAADTAVVLMYHRFGEDEYPSTSIRIDQLEAQLAYLHEHDYTVVPLERVLAALETGAPLPERAVAITVDDAYRSVYAVGFPRLVAAGLPFTVFVSSDPVDRRLPDYMTWDEMREMAQMGVSFGNHAAVHDSVLMRVAGEDETARLARVRANVEAGARRLAEELEPLGDAFAWPYGEYDTASADLLRDMGYVSFGQHSGAVGPLSDLRALPRFPMSEAFGGMDQFPDKVSSRPLPVLRLDPWDPVTSARLPAVEVDLGDADARLAELTCYVGGQGRVDVIWLRQFRSFRVGSAAPLGVGRHRVNCTAPRSDGGWLWFSHQWIIQADSARGR